jgi:hypothetical protein
MYKSISSPVFPHLFFVKDASFGSWNYSLSKTTKIYKLNWNNFDDIILKRHQEFNQKCWPNQSIPIVQKFDPHYEEILQSLKFAVPIHYMDAIHDATNSAMSEWNKERRFDTNIREMCLQPAIKFVEVAFRLLCDCAYDEITNYFYRAENKYLLPHLLLFRFWQNQTGAGLIEEHAGFGELQLKLSWLKKQFLETQDDPTKTTRRMPRDGEEEEIKHLEKFLHSFNEQSTKVLNAHMFIYDDDVVTGPSIGEQSADQKKALKFI